MGYLYLYVESSIFNSKNTRGMGLLFFSQRNYYYSTVNGGRIQNFEFSFISFSIGFFFADTDDSQFSGEREGAFFIYFYRFRSLTSIKTFF